MEGGKIVRIIGGQSVKVAKKSITFTATEGDLTFNSPTKVVMTGKQGGVKYLNDYKPPPPLRVVKVEGPFNEQGEKVSILEKGGSYTYKAIEFNRELRTGIDSKGIKWAIQYNDEDLIFATKATGKQEVTLDISEAEPSEKITIYAYFENPIQEASAEVILKTGEPGYIIISTVNGFGANVLYKYDLEGKVYAQTEDAEMNEKTFKSIEYKGRLDEFAKKIYADLELLRANSEGKKLLEFFENGKHTVIISIPKKTTKDTKQFADGKSIVYSGMPTELPAEGNKFAIDIPSYIILSHEMGHVKSYHLGQQNLSYWNRIMIDEIYATHIENKIRKAAGIPLRDIYERDKFEGTRLVDEEHYSLYINKEESNYLNLKPKKLDRTIAYNYDIIQKDQ